MQVEKPKFTRDQIFLIDQAKRFTKQMQADFHSGKVRFVDSDIAHTAEISEAGGIYDLLRTTNDKQVGVSDFDSNKLEAGVNAAIGRVKLGFAKALASTNPKAEDMNYSSELSAFPAELLRSKFIMKQDNKTLCRLPVERFTVGAKSQKSQGEEDVLHLGSPMILIEGKPINIQLEFNPNAGMNPGTGSEAYKYFIQVRFMGAETAAR